MGAGYKSGPQRAANGAYAWRLQVYSNQAVRIRKSDFGAVILISNQDLNKRTGLCSKLSPELGAIISSEFPDIEKQGYFIYEVVVHLSTNGDQAGI
jgi:hypothetical protein